MRLYENNDKLRQLNEAKAGYPPETDFRTAFKRDFDRLIHSSCFRRLQGKTQLFPGIESDFFRNRLTHSLEVAQIAKSIALKLNYEQADLNPNSLKIDLDLVEFAGLAHDLGHPPFGHQGEEMLDYLMRNEGGYEGNAQTLRILTKIEKKGFTPISDEIIFKKGIDTRVGLNLSARTLASILKYDSIIPFSESERKLKQSKIKPLKAYYSFDNDLVKWIKKQVIGNENHDNFKTIECQIMDLADDIAYSTYDLEDGLKAGFYNLFDGVFASKKLRDSISKELKDKKYLEEFNINEDVIHEVLKRLFGDFLDLGDIEFAPGIRDILKDNDIAYIYASHNYEISQEFSRNGYSRTYLTSKLVNRFIDGVRFKYDRVHPSQSKVFLKPEILLDVEVLKKFTYISQVQSSRLKIAEYRGKEIVKEIFTNLTNKEKGGHELLPDDFRDLYDKAPKKDCNRVICDFIAGMTDRYAIEFYGRLKSENPETIFKPI